MAVEDLMKPYGYLREIMNDDQDYSSIIRIIIQYYEQGFARYFDENLNKDFMKQIKFGDIVKRLNNDYMVFNDKKLLINVGHYESGAECSTFTIPLSICDQIG